MPNLGRVVSETFSKGPLIARARLLQHAISAGGRLPVILVGQDRDTAALAAALPRRAYTAIVGTTVCEPHARSTEITGVAFSALRRFREKQSVTTAAAIAAQWEPRGSAFAGPVNALVSIERGIADAVWLAQDNRPEAALICSGCAKVEWALLRLTLCRNCGDNISWYPTDSREQLVRAAVRAGCAVHVLWNPGVFGTFGGVACLVRTAADAQKVRKVA